MVLCEARRDGRTSRATPDERQLWKDCLSVYSPTNDIVECLRHARDCCGMLYCCRCLHDSSGLISSAPNCWLSVKPRQCPLQSAPAKGICLASPTTIPKARHPSAHLRLRNGGVSAMSTSSVSPQPYPNVSSGLGKLGPHRKSSDSEAGLALGANMLATPSTTTD